MTKFGKMESFPSTLFQKGGGSPEARSLWSQSADCEISYEVRSARGELKKTVRWTVDYDEMRAKAKPLRNNAYEKLPFAEKYGALCDAL